MLFDRAISSYDEKVLNDSIFTILKWHVNHDTKLGAKTLPGSSQEEIDNVEKKLGYKIPNELRILYGRINGYPNDKQFIWYHRLIPLEKAVSLIDDIRKYNPNWKSNWLPFMEFQTEYYFLKLRNESSLALPVYLEFPYQKTTYAYVNVTTLFKTGAEFLSSNEVELEESGYMVVDSVGRIKKIYEINNKDLIFPYEE